MTFWIVAALMAATATAFFVTPLFLAEKKEGHRILGAVLCLMIPFLALAIYFFCGNPFLTQ